MIRAGLAPLVTIGVIALLLVGYPKPGATPLTLPNGRAGLAIRSGGSNMLMSDCYTKAGELCPRGYGVLTSNTSERPSFGGTPSTAVASSYSAREILVECH
jgi:hypothetical protein